MIRVTVNEHGAVLHIQGIPQKATESLRKAIARETISLANHIKADKLSGQVLKNRTGNLRRAVRAYPPGVELSVIRGEVAVDKAASKYGRVHEYGGTFTIRQHMRTSKLGKRFSVRAHSATYPERSFMRSGLADRREQIVQSIRQAVHEAVA